MGVTFVLCFGFGVLSFVSLRSKAQLVWWVGHGGGRSNNRDRTSNGGVHIKTFPVTVSIMTKKTCVLLLQLCRLASFQFDSPFFFSTRACSNGQPSWRCGTSFSRRI